MSTVASAVELLQLLADPNRVRLLALLSKHELSVAELVGALGLGQSRVSTHLGRLREAGLVRDRRVGTSTFYALSEGTMGAEASELWALVSSRLDDAVLEGDRARGEAAVRARAGGWPEAWAGEMERHYSPGRTWEALARGVGGLLRLGEVIDIGAGDGAIAQLLAPRAQRYTLLDRSETMIEAARQRLAGARNVRLRVGDAEELPFEDGAFSEALLFNVLVCAANPARVLREACRVLGEGGRLVATTLGPHQHPEVAASYQHLHPGFAPTALRAMLRRAGFQVDSCAVTSRERRPPYFDVVTAIATKSTP